MYDYNNENELYNNEINDLTDIRLETEKYKNNKYNEDEIVMNENINLEEQNSINDENYINEDFVEQYDINNINNNINDEFDITFLFHFFNHFILFSFFTYMFDLH